jgi:hypothetical protein
MVCSPPEPTVKDAGVPIAPLAFENEIVPVHDGGVPVDDELAVFATVIEAVSLLAKPTGGNTYSRVPLTGSMGVAICDSIGETVATSAAAEIKNTLPKEMVRQYMFHLFPDH